MGPVFFWLLVLVALLLVAAVGVLWFRRWFRTDQDADPIGFTLDDLRQLHREGRMSDDEFERAKAQLIAGTRRALERDASKLIDDRPAAGELDLDFKPPADDQPR